MPKSVRFLTAAFVSFSVAQAASAEPSSLLPLTHGLFVKEGTACADFTTSTTLAFWGDSLNSARMEGWILDVVQNGDNFAVTMDVVEMGSTPDEPNDPVTWQIVISAPDKMTIDSEHGASSYRWCAASSSEMAAADRTASAMISDENHDLPFIGEWGYPAEGELRCYDGETTTFTNNSIDNGHMLVTFERDDVTEVEPGHWRLHTAGGYEGEEFSVIFDVHIDGDAMRKVSRSPDGHAYEDHMQRCL
ncbi:hypothetical protein [Roseinatronobacter monicus]|uniref:Uncharacterized protein n=1 Tax=Roseinatronobacter monicus TaxID=393481 RepID=A0A543KIJ8_9RHOB|nr:hypothetical protein [Roseinatronobacter monicus]TQM94906.1 hypothetical protein BD293_3597 [Roseinatronobacter monicus]